MQKFKEYRFIPLNPPEFLNYERAELLLIEKGAAKTEDKEPEIQDCLTCIPDEDISKQMEFIEDSQTIVPFIQAHMK